MIIKNIVHSQQYTAKDGTLKNKYSVIGVAFIQDRIDADGNKFESTSLKFDYYPVSTDGIISLMLPKE
jgi:hypothetical protein